MMIEERLADARVLDLFCGAGTLGLEALSRGARQAVFVDSSRMAVSAVKDNLSRLDWTDRAQVRCGDVFRYMARRPSRRDRFDLILADPPYGLDYGARVLSRLASRSSLWFNPGALLVIQTGRRDELADSPPGFELAANKLYGETRIRIFNFVPGQTDCPKPQDPQEP